MMKTGTLLPATWKIRNISFLVVGLLVLAGIHSNPYLAVAQTQEGCSLPVGVTPVAPPDVTAQ